MRTGVFGGSFSPVHNGHIYIAEAFIRQCGLDELFIIPTGTHPVKTNLISTIDRLEMCRLGFHSIQKVIVSDMELRREGISYSYDTMMELKKNGCDDLFFLCGTDMLLILEKWYRSAELMKACTIVHAGRGMNKDTSSKVELVKKHLINTYNAKIVDLVLDERTESSSEIRTMIQNGMDVSKMLPEDELKYIQKRELFFNV